MEKLLRLVPAVEYARAGRAPSSGVGRDHNRELGATHAKTIDGAQGGRDIRAAVEHDDVGLRVPHVVDDPVGGGQLVDLELAPLEQEARELYEARIAARDEDARARLRLVVPSVAGRIRASVRDATGCPRDPVSDLEAAAVALARGKLDDLPCSATRRGSPGPEIPLDRDHDLVRVEEDDV